MGQSFSTPPLSITQTPILAVPAATTYSSTTSSLPLLTSNSSDSKSTNPLRRALNAPPPLDPATRTRRQAGLFFGGAAFVVFSALVTRRSLTRRNRVIPSLTPAPAGVPVAGGVAPNTTAAALKSGAAQPAAAEAAGGEAVALENSGPILAVEALTLATLNVVSWAIMTTGGLLWYFDIASLEEMRRKVRGGLGVDGSGRTEEEAEEEMEEWLASVLARKEGKEDAVRRVEEDAEGGRRRNERGRER